MRVILITALLAGLTLASSCSLHHSRGEAYAGELSTDSPLVAPPDEGDEYSPSTLIILYDVETGTAAIDRAIEDYGAEVIYRYNIINGIAIRIPDGKDIHDAIKRFERVEGVLAVNRDRRMHLMQNGKAQ